MHIIGIGTDITEIKRIAHLSNKYSGFRTKILTADEISDPRSLKPEYIAGRWSAKESIAKAIGNGFTENCRIRDISILNDSAGRPIASLHGPTLEYCDRICGPKYKIHLSISHDVFAVAFCVIESYG